MRLEADSDETITDKEPLAESTDADPASEEEVTSDVDLPSHSEPELLHQCSVPHIHRGPGRSDDD
ncbi:predicted protein [Plenodomus lingam JN3]|uniref:Predicted protein n=1 Tax=Leptosphaeria maculans (strain JN3 / isolate v23.1.3 / race Av1-4-5-6-7-8) TaxID=985895 RepID=E5A1K5_LEPMJ|nr:predicted protein [Plenodomus lingam JN3]CBX97469.1 predicted protein [Plenodomus lingam JN3]